MAVWLTELLGIGVVGKNKHYTNRYHWLHTFVLTRFTLAAELSTLRPITLLAISCSSKPAKEKPLRTHADNTSWL